MTGELTPSEINDLLSREVTGNLACFDKGVVYMVPISYVFDGECIYGHSKNGLKNEMMRNNPQVCFEVDNLKDLGNWQSVITWGRYEELGEEKEKEAALRLLQSRAVPLRGEDLPAGWPFSEAATTEMKGILFKIRIKKITGRFERTA